MSNSKIFNSSDLGDAEGYHIGLFDRIINLKFTRADGTFFTLRSDYEPVWSGDRLFFKPCQPKPDIRVTYTQYIGATITIDVFVTNLNILDDAAIDVESLISSKGISTSPQIQGEYTNLPNDALTAIGNKQIKEIEIELGYRGQMFDWSKYDSSIVSPEVAYAAFQNLEQIQFTSLITQDDRVAATELTNSQVLFQAYRRCKMTIQQAFNTSNPPDRITQFQGYIGTPDKGFAPFAFQTFGDPSSESTGTEAILTQSNIFKELNDKDNPIDLVTAKTDNTDAWALLTNNEKNVYRNLFNGGREFKFLEAFCFHTVTRRFVRSNVNMKKNSSLEQASMEYSQEIQKNPDTLTVVETYQNNILQSIYKEEKTSNTEYFTDSTDEKGNKVLVLTAKAPASYVEALNKKAKNIIAEQNIGSRYTIRNLPEYHKLYKAIRNKLAEAALQQKYMSWWAAALELKTESISKELLSSRAIGNTIEDVRKYTLDLHEGKLNNVDCYFDDLLGKEWIVPVQTMLNSTPARNARGLEIQVTVPTKTSASGFSAPGALQSIKCFTGLFAVRDAYLFGVPILCSDKASSKFDALHSSKQSVQAQFFSNCKSQVEWICKTYGLNCYKLHNGGYYLYDPTENAKMMSSQTFVSEQSNRPFKIPAVYDFNLSPVRVIRMPFVGFLDPFTVVEWNSTSVIGAMVSFYYQPAKGRNLFYTISSEIDFSTVGDFNMMTIQVTDTPDTEPAQIPKTATNTEQKTYYRDVIIIPDAELSTWKKIHEATVTKIPLDLVRLWLYEEPNEDMNITNDNRVSNFEFFRQMYKWNKSLFGQAAGSTTAGSTWDDSKQRIDSEADKAYGNTRPAMTPNTIIPHFPNIDYCITKLTDSSLKRIYMKIPMMPLDSDYEKMENIDNKRVVVYEKGTWYLQLKSEMSEYKIGAD